MTSFLYTIFFNGNTAEISNNMAQWLLTAAAAQQLPGHIFAATAQEPAAWLVLGTTEEGTIPKTADLTCTCTLKQARQALAVAAPGSVCFLYGDDSVEIPWAQVQQGLTKKNLRGGLLLPQKQLTTALAIALYVFGSALKEVTEANLCLLDDILDAIAAWQPENARQNIDYLLAGMAAPLFHLCQREEKERKEGE
jgi:hypothetical protein